MRAWATFSITRFRFDSQGSLWCSTIVLVS